MVFDRDFEIAAEAFSGFLDDNEASALGFDFTADVGAARSRIVIGATAGTGCAVGDHGNGAQKRPEGEEEKKEFSARLYPNVAFLHFALLSARALR
jgi:hypothetical protein